MSIFPDFRRLRPHRLLRGAAWTLLALLALTAIFIAWPLPDELLEPGDLVSLRFTDRTGRTLRELRSRQDGRSVPLPGGKVPPLVRAAFLSAEDRRFFEHHGVDPVAVARAVRQNLAAGRVVSGASTITQQLVRRLRPHPRSLPGKLYEMAWALRLEAHLDKERILLEYLNRVPLGNSSYGVEAASELYFGRTASELSAAQAALLAGLARSPAGYDPYRHPERARKRLKYVLSRMEADGSLTAEARRVAADSALDLTAPERVFEAPHLMAWLERNLEGLGIGEAARVETTLDPWLQKAVEEAIRIELEGLVDRRVGQAAAIVIDNATGEVLAYAGSADFLDDARGGQNDGVRAMRQPGSALKPFAYGLALASGRTPADVLSDVETHLATPSGDYVPKNYDRRVHGPVRLRAALANSYNVPAVRLAEDLGPDRVLDVLRRAGFESLQEEASHYGVGIVLGNGDVSLREGARAFRGLARGGEVGPLREVRRAWAADGRALEVKLELEPRRFLPPDAVALLTDILSDETARAPAFGLDNALRLPFPVAVKTGTSRAHVDNWTLGYTRERTVGVWVGNFDGTPMKGVSGITGAGPLFKRVMVLAMQGIVPLPLVDRSRFERADICPLSGQLAGPACAGVMHEVFLPGSAPKGRCSMHLVGMVDARTGAPVPCGSPGGRARPVLDVGPAYYGWARGEGLAAGPPSITPCTPDGADGAMNGVGAGGVNGVVKGAAAGGANGARLLFPTDGDEFLLDPGLPIDAQTVPVRVQVPAGMRRVEVRTGDGRVVGLEAPFSTRLAFAPGRHRVELWVPGEGRPTAVAWFRVR